MERALMAEGVLAGQRRRLGEEAEAHRAAQLPPKGVP